MNKRKLKLKIWVAILFWIALIIIHFTRVIPFLDDEGLRKQIKTILTTFPLDMVTFSVFYFWIIPTFLDKKQHVWTILFTLFYWAVYGFVYGSIYHISGRTETYEDFFVIYKSSIGHTLLHFLYAIALHLSVDWYFKWKNQQKLEEENTQIKLSMLKAQINPHFLFNVLNNIHSLAHKDADKTADSIIKLSEIMRYMLYESEQEKVTLEKEIDHIYSYLNLQKLRLIEQESVSFKVQGKTDGISIAPLIFIAFVENAFKHGQKNVKNAIEISINVEGNRLYFQCSNLIRKMSETEERSEGKIGLKNIKRRLELLYENNYTLNIKQDNERFEVELEIIVE
ncbi:MAG: histidine kinase [Crocinitomicaceae bacterium]|nr:histidine kinase [Crocinitomicaceae bacterium]